MLLLSAVATRVISSQGKNRPRRLQLATWLVPCGDCPSHKTTVGQPTKCEQECVVRWPVKGQPNERVSGVLARWQVQAVVSGGERRPDGAWWCRWTQNCRSDWFHYFHNSFINHVYHVLSIIMSTATRNSGGVCRNIDCGAQTSLSCTKKYPLFPPILGRSNATRYPHNYNCRLQNEFEPWSWSSWFLGIYLSRSTTTLLRSFPTGLDCMHSMGFFI